jgi:hypothetical protein
MAHAEFALTIFYSIIKNVEKVMFQTKMTV